MTSPKTTRLVGFGGYKESGKDAAADALVATLGFEKDSVSLAIDAAARGVNPIIEYRGGLPVHYGTYVDKVCGGDFTLAKENPEVRRFLQKIGALGRSVRESVWTDRAEERMLQTLHAGGNYALTGVRFPIEIEMVRRNGGLLVWISRPDAEDRSDTDVTENSVGPDDFDVMILNDGTLEQLREKTLSLISRPRS